MWHSRHGEHCVEHVDHAIHLAQITGEWMKFVRYVVMSGVTTCLNVTLPTQWTLCRACRPRYPPGSNNRWVKTFCQVRRYEWRHYLFKCDTPDRWVKTFCQVRRYEWRHYLFKCDTPDRWVNTFCQVRRYMSDVTTCLNVTHPTRRTLCRACRPRYPPGSNNRWVKTFCQVRRYEWRHYLFKCDTPDTVNIVSSMSTTLSTWLKQQVSENILSGTSLWVASLPV